MTDFMVRINTDNDAFSVGDDNYEIARILRGIADDLDDGALGGIIRDVNGNSVGTWRNF